MKTLFFFILAVFCAVLSSCITAAAAEEYYSIGTAYYELKKFDEAEKWFTKASGIKKTMHASEYNLGRIAYEAGRYDDAAGYFARVIKSDPKNAMALRAAAYTEIMRGNFAKADEYYIKVMELEPESSDDGYNHALVLYAMKKYGEAEGVLNQFSYSMPDNKNNLLLLARVQRAQKKVEAVETYSFWLAGAADPVVRSEYISALEDAGYYARAIEETRKLVTELTTDTAALNKSGVYFLLARLLLTADPNNEDGMKQLQNSLSAGFKDADALSALAKDNRVSKVNQGELQNSIAKILAESKAESKTSAEK